MAADYVANADSGFKQFAIPLGSYARANPLRPRKTFQ